MPSDRYGEGWTEQELVLALHLYCQLPFRKTKASTPAVIELSRRLGRTPASVARKLGNFGAFDPTLAAAGISGLAHFSRADQAIWSKYSSDWGALADDAAKILGTVLQEEPLPEEGSVRLPTGPSEVESLVRLRRHQAFFRRTVLASYGATCCICELEIPDLLIASHIVPWSENEALRSDPTNGLCLCCSHDRAFDRGYLSLTQEGLIVTSPLLGAFESGSCRTLLREFNGARWIPPSRFMPNGDYLKWHQEHVFRA